MRIDQLTDLQVAIAAALILGAAYLLYRLIPPADTATRQRRYTDEEIAAYDGALPKYFLVGLGALALGGLHAAFKSLPPVYEWLTLAGHGGHMARDLANTHLVIVIGGTVTATGLTWYALPRVARRPLFSTALASWSFWLTVIGATGFYLANTVLGIVFGVMHNNGIDYEVAKPMLGALRSAPIGMSAGIMGIGYWTFVLNVFLTIWAARRTDAPRPQGHLLKYFAIGAFGLFVGTVQGVIQVLPDNESWLHAAAPAGEYIDPIAHAHVNLVTGTLTLTAGLIFFWMGRRRTDAAVEVGRRRTENAIWWVLVPGSLLFYLTFMFLGFSEGNLMVNDGLSFQQAVARMGALHVVPLMISGILTLTGAWLLLGTIVHRSWRGPDRRMVGAPMLVLGAAALFVGTGQGMVQALPGVKAWIVGAGEPGDALANAHAQLNMIGGVILLLLGLLFTDARELLGRHAAHLRVSRTGTVAAAGIGLYYVAAVATSVVMGNHVIAGRPLELAVSGVQPWGPMGMSIGAAFYVVAFAGLLDWAWDASATYRREAWGGLMDRIERYNKTDAPWRRRIPARYFVMAEAVFSFAGFPGVGWMMSGRPLLGIPMAFAGCGIAWAVIPLLMAPDLDTLLADAGQLPLFVWLSVTAVLSTGSLALTLQGEARRRRVRQPAHARPMPVTTDL